jgi:hypothetical protein
LAHRLLIGADLEEAAKAIPAEKAKLDTVNGYLSMFSSIFSLFGK